MNRNLLFVILAVAIISCTVGLGVHLMHKEARANAGHFVTITDILAVPLADVLVEIGIETSGGWEFVEERTNALGVVSDEAINHTATADNWTYEITDEYWQLDPGPGDGPVDVFYPVHATVQAVRAE